MRLILIVVVALACVACEPTKPSDADAVTYVNRMTFARGKNSQCFGVVEYITYAGYKGVSITAVPSELCQ